MIDHVGIYGARVAEGLSASNVGLVLYDFKSVIHGSLPLPLAFKTSAIIIKYI